MQLRPFALERYFAEYEFKVAHMLSPSDCETISLERLLQLATPEGLAIWQELRLGYTEPMGHPMLRAAVAKLYREMTVEGILIAAPEEAIFVAMHGLLSPGDQVVAITPAYQSLHEIPRSIGCSVTSCSLRPEGQRWTLDLGELERAVTDQTRLLVINFPHNPTGHLLTRGELDSVVSIARRHGTYVFSDEMYRLLEYDPADRLPAMCDLYERGISLSGLSKAFGLPGLRIGWLATREHELLRRWMMIKDYTTICNSAPSEALAIMAIGARETLLERARQIVRANLELAQRFFGERHESFTWFAPRAGSIAFPRWNGPGSVDQLCQRALDSKGVMIAPGGLFDAPGNHFRIGLGRESFPEALRQLGEHLSSA